jgi:hypothetical protein
MWDSDNSSSTINVHHPDTYTVCVALITVKITITTAYARTIVKTNAVVFSFKLAVVAALIL